MIDPISAAVMAGKAYAGVRALIETGRSIEDTMTQMAKWQGYASDVVYASKKKQNTGFLKKAVFSKSVEQEAAELFAARKRIENQRKELISMLNMAYGVEGVQQYRAIIKEVNDQRQQEIYAAQENKEITIQICMIFFMIGFASWLIAFILSKV